MQTVKIGYNTENFFETLNPDIEADIVSLSATSKIVERHPGGGTTAKINPYKYRQGWGINQECIDLILPPGKNDEEREEWIGKMGRQPDFSYMDQLADRCANNPNLEIVWTANVFAASLSDNMEAIAYMLEQGVNIKYIECDNEAYFNQKYVDFYAYAEKFVPFLRAVKARWPHLKTTIGTAPVNGSRKHTEWNNAAVTYVDEFDCVTPHIYFGAKELPEAFELYPAIPYVVDYTERDETLHGCFEKFVQAAFNNGAWKDEIDTLKELFPGKPIVITEFNTNPGDYFGNTIANEAWVFFNYLSKDPAIEVMCVQSGAGQILNCRWSNTRKQDVASAYGTLRRMGYHTFKLLSEIDEVNNFNISANSMTFTSPGVYYGWFVNMSSNKGEVMFSVPLGLKFNGEATVNAISGNFLYSSCGAAGFQAKNQPQAYECSISRFGYSGPVTLPAYGFGYVKFEVVAETPAKPKLTWWERLLIKLGFMSAPRVAEPVELKVVKGKDVFLALGASSPKIEFAELIRRYATLPDRNPNLQLINGCQGGLAVEKILSDPTRYFDKYVGDILRKQGFRNTDVKYIWLKTDSLSSDIRSLSKASYVAKLTKMLSQAVALSKARFPSAQIYLSGRHDGYVDKHAAPRAEYNHLATLAVCESGVATLAHPFYLQNWGPDYVQPDGVHPNTEGTTIAVNYMIDWYRLNTNWFAK